MIDQFLLFLQEQDLTDSTMQLQIAKIGRAARLEMVLTPHMLRHTFGKNLIDAKISIDRVAKLMGHTNINTTAGYTIPSGADLAAAVDSIAWSD